MRLYLFDDGVADGWDPFALTRPCSELRFGSLTLRERWELVTDRPVEGLLTRSWLGGFEEPGAPPVRRGSELPEDVPRLLLRSRFVPEPPFPTLGEGPATLRTADEMVGCLVPAGAATPGEAWFRQPAPLPGAVEVELHGAILEHAWELIDRNPDRLLADLRGAASGEGPLASAAPPPASDLPEGVHALGDGPVLLGNDVTLEPGVVLDTRGGPIRLDARVTVRAGTRLAGPLHAGADSRLLGGTLDRISAGPVSYLRGEVEASVILGYTNKAHDGYLGHAYLGRWVNLGAMTTNSDLKNNYSTVRLGPPERRVDTGLLKLGCLLGDHVKTGIGLLIGTGTVVGAGSNLYGGAPPAWVPAFSWGRGERLQTHRREAFLRTAAIAMGRRGIEAGASMRACLGAAWDVARAEAGLEPASGGGSCAEAREDHGAGRQTP